jgi:hypothetical protein
MQGARPMAECEFDALVKFIRTHGHSAALMI